MARRLDYSRPGAGRDLIAGRPLDGATPAQVRFIATLARERGVKVKHPKKRPWTFEEASEKIEELKALPRK